MSYEGTLIATPPGSGRRRDCRFGVRLRVTHVTGVFVRMPHSNARSRLGGSSITLRAQRKGVAMKRLAALVAPVAIVVLAGSTPAAAAPKLARRDPTSTERTRIAVADGIPARCETIFV